ncbi:MAG: GFA family protein [Alcanivorax sp.]|nr:type I-B CRISPR-associated protein Cas8b1/Cst1 [Alcanivorax sp. KX64203]MBA4720788.1 GFA family protein [Alcanivorax sp.]
MNTYQGSCHCQSVVFEVRCSLDMAYMCDCSICTRKGARMVYAEQTDFRLLKGENSLGCYQFNTKVAEHYFCRTCGIYTHHKPRSLPGKYGINAGCLQGIDPFNLEITKVNGGSR